MSGAASAADAAGHPEDAGGLERTGRPGRRPVDERLMATGTVLDSIVAARRERIGELRERFGHLRAAGLPRSQRSFADALRTRSGGGASPRPALIMECKAASPSRGTIRGDYDPAGLARAYAPWAAAVSVLTEPDRFNGSFEDLAAVRAAVDAPVLCKDFVVDPVQVLAARSLGADAILLMLSVVPDDVYRELADLAADLGMEVLTEVCTPEQMHRAARLGARVIGINKPNHPNFSRSYLIPRGEPNPSTPPLSFPAFPPRSSNSPRKPSRPSTTWHYSTALRRKQC